MSESESAIPDEILMAPFLILAAVRNTRKMFSPEDAKKKLVEFTKTFEAGCKQATVKTILAQVLSGADKLMANAFAADTEIDANTLIVTIKTQVTTKMVTEASNVYLLYLLELSECLTHETNLMGNTRIVEESAEFYGVVVKNLAVMAAPELPPMEEELTIKEVAKTKPAKSKGHMLKIIVVFIVLGIFLAIAAVIAGVVGFNKTKEFNFIKLVKDGDYTKLKYGLMFHPDRINKADSKSNELIHLAVKSENEEIVALLIANGANLDAEGYLKKRPLNYACAKENLSLMEMLAEAGADVDAQMKYQLSLIHLASRNGKPDIIEFLIDEDADMLVLDMHKKTALHFAAEAGQSKVIKMLVDAEIPINAKDKDGQTALHLAAIENDTAAIIQELIDNGADIEAESNNKRSPLMLAVIHENLIIVETLIKNKANKSHLDKKGWSLMHYAVKLQKAPLIRHLKKLGVPHTIKDKSGKTPRAYARTNKLRDLLD